MEFSDGYKKVYKFRCEPIGNGLWQITCWLKSSLTKEEYSYQCYTREKNLAMRIKTIFVINKGVIQGRYY